MNIGQGVKLCRETTGNTQRKATEYLGISAGHLCNIEQGHRMPSEQLLERMAVWWAVDPRIVAWLLDPPSWDCTPTTERFRRSYFNRHGIIPADKANRVTH